MYELWICFHPSPVENSIRGPLRHVALIGISALSQSGSSFSCWRAGFKRRSHCPHLLSGPRSVHVTGLKPKAALKYTYTHFRPWIYLIVCIVWPVVLRWSNEMNIMDGFNGYCTVHYCMYWRGMSLDFQWISSYTTDLHKCSNAFITWVDAQLLSHAHSLI